MCVVSKLKGNTSILTTLEVRPLPFQVVHGRIVRKNLRSPFADYLSS